MAALPSPSTYHGMFAHVHSTGRGYFAHGGAWYELVNADLTGRVGTGTESYFIDRLVSTSTTATSLNVVGVATFGGNVDVNGNVFDADGHVELDNVNIAGVTTFAGNIDANGDIDVDGHTELDNLRVSGIATVQDDLHLPDASKLLMGDNNEFRIYHNESNSLNYIVAQNNGPLLLRSSNADMIHCSPQGAVTLKYDGTTRAATSSSGFDVSGTLNVTGISTFAGAIDANGDLDVDGHTNLDNVSISGVTTFSGTVTFEGVSTHSDHIHLLDSKRLKLGSAANGDAVLLHDGTDTILDNQTGSLFLRSGTHKLQALNANDMIVGNAGGSVELYHNNIINKNLIYNLHINNH